jgi:anti-sigma factor RsiW
MCDKELLVEYVYDELEAAERKTIQQHLASCRECRDEAQALRGTRSHLAAWQVPSGVPSLQPVVANVSPAARFRIRSGWGLAAAATLVLAAASAVANLQIQAVDGGLVIRTGWSQAANQQASNAAPQTPEISREELAAVLQRINQLETALATQPSAAPVTRVSHTPGATTDAEVLRRVRQLVADSESRQQQALAARLMQGMREMQAAHTSDLMRVERATNQLQGAFNDEVLRAREMEKQFYRLVSSTQLQR